MNNVCTCTEHLCSFCYAEEVLQNCEMPHSRSMCDPELDALERKFLGIESQIQVINQLLHAEKLKVKNANELLSKKAEYWDKQQHAVSKIFLNRDVKGF